MLKEESLSQMELTIFRDISAKCRKEGIALADYYNSVMGNENRIF